MPSILVQYGPLIATLLMALSVGWLTWIVLSIVSYPKAQLGTSGAFERGRREELRSGSSVYRWFEQLVDEMSALFRSRGPRMERLRRDLAVVNEPLPWHPEEFLATKQIEGILASLGLWAALLLLDGFMLASFLTALTIMCYTELARKAVHDRATKRLDKIRRRLPFVVDLIALMMEAGASFTESLQTVVDENQDHPLGEEFGNVLREMKLGRPLAETLRSLEERLGDDDVRELVFAIIKGEELGTPLSKILRIQADQMRLKRSQWGEKAAAQAQVKMVFPGIIVMIACLLVVIAPFVLPAILPLFQD